LDLGMLQREAARAIGVSPATYRRWEAGRSAPALCHEPRLIAFLGEDPRPAPTTVAGQLQLLRGRKGLSLRAFAAKNYDLHEDTIRRRLKGTAENGQTSGSEYVRLKRESRARTAACLSANFSEPQVIVRLLRETY
jgi:DNA-binding XRE family transcriptional regulator